MYDSDQDVENSKSNNRYYCPVSINSTKLDLGCCFTVFKFAITRDFKWEKSLNCLLPK